MTLSLVRVAGTVCLLACLHKQSPLCLLGAFLQGVKLDLVFAQHDTGGVKIASPLPVRPQCPCFLNVWRVTGHHTVVCSVGLLCAEEAESRQERWSGCPLNVSWYLGLSGPGEATNEPLSH